VSLEDLARIELDKIRHEARNAAEQEQEQERTEEKRRRQKEQRRLVTEFIALARRYNEPPIDVEAAKI
jgi:hypothetical protein